MISIDLQGGNEKDEHDSCFGCGNQNPGTMGVYVETPQMFKAMFVEER